MSRKNILLIIAFVVIAALAAIIIYRGFYGGSSNPSGLLGIAPGEVNAAAPILPQGDTLDYGPVKAYNSHQQLFDYPAVTTNDVSLPLQDLIK